MNYCKLSPEHKGLWSVHLAILLLGGTGLFAQLVELPALDITFYRCAIAAILLWAVLLFSQQRIRLVSKKDIAPMLFLAVLVVSHWVTYFYAMQWSSVAMGMIALYTYPVITVLIEPAITKKPLQRADLVCATVVFFGIVIMLPHDSQDANLVAGLLLGVLSALLFAGRNLLYKYKLSHYNGPQTMFYQVVNGALMLLPFFFQGISGNGLPPLHDAYLLILLGTVFTALPHALLVTSLRHLAAKSVALIACLQPLYGLLFAAVVLAEIPTWQTLAGGALVLSGTLYETLKPAKNMP
ncbi:DMT family transporter [Motilimonas pumila]|uniref:DMT family transporter n=1 Tax=Motilimonas pumila TaxID=2303987 RepID=A0A418YCN0_9GAMM|nr:DMT family transporter [Motilimonas pumila]RJG42290.1 DMT family transporter [Motilimonas pumila]